ncbi:MAG: PEP-CTERM sorting domain-containing protein [Terracidiphilus sp.]
MKKLVVSTVLAVSAFCFLFWLSPLKAYADTVTLTLENVGPGNNSGGVYTYPYNFSIDGSSSYVSLMCFEYNDEIYEGETWTATVVPIDSSSSQEDLELAYLFSVASNSSTPAATVADAQWGAWEMFDPGLTAPTQNGVTQAGVSAELASAENADLSEFDSGYALYIPESGWPSTDGLPQSFVGPSPAPEPSSLLLLGSGLLACACTVYFKKRRTA